MRHGSTPKPIPIGQPRELVRADLERLKEDRHVPSSPQKLRDSHHRIARLAAAGLRSFEIAERTGYGVVRVRSLLGSPAMEELVARYRVKVDEEFVKTQDEYYALATANMLAAERHINDHIAELDESGELLPVRTALAISRDGADRFGYGKKAMNVNLNVDFAAQLESAIKRSGKAHIIEGQVAKSSSPTPSPMSPAPHPTSVAHAPPREHLPPPHRQTTVPSAEPRPLIRRRA